MFFWMTIQFFSVGFWIKFGSRKLFFFTNIEKKTCFFKSNFKMLYNCGQLFGKNMCVLSYQNYWMVKKKYFSWMWQKIQNLLQKKSYSVFINGKNCIFKHNKTCFGKMWFYFFVTFMKNDFASICCFFYRTKRTCCQHKLPKL